MEKPFTSTTSKVSCTACGAAKVKCQKDDDGPTCRRCQKKGLECIPHESKQGQRDIPNATKEKKKKEPMSAKERKRKSRKNRSEEKDQQEKESNKARETKRRHEKKEREAADELARQQQQQQEQQQQQQQQDTLQPQQPSIPQQHEDQQNIQPQPPKRFGKNRNRFRGYGPERAKEMLAAYNSGQPKPPQQNPPQQNRLVRQKRPAAEDSKSGTNQQQRTPGILDWTSNESLASLSRCYDQEFLEKYKKRRLEGTEDDDTEDDDRSHS